jgi:hypothetical protein
MIKETLEQLADKLSQEVTANGKPKRIKVKILMGYFNYEKRTEQNATKITELLAKRKILLNPSIMKLGETWQLKFDDALYLTKRTNGKTEDSGSVTATDIYDYKNDKWFDEIQTKNYRTEKEVENKFILPLIDRLGFNENDRYDGMIIKTCHGSKATSLEVDFALFNSDNKNLEGQTLLIVEAKKEEKLYKKIELDKAQKQVKSYAVWLSCHFGLVTDSKVIQIIDLFPSINGMNVIFECNRETLKENFEEIYKLTSKTNLTSYYEKLIK